MARISHILRQGAGRDRKEADRGPGMGRTNARTHALSGRAAPRPQAASDSPGEDPRSRRLADELRGFKPVVCS